jgi:hypothetical protein
MIHHSCDIAESLPLLVDACIPFSLFMLLFLDQGHSIFTGKRIAAELVLVHSFIHIYRPLHSFRISGISLSFLRQIFA